MFEVFDFDSMQEEYFNKELENYIFINKNEEAKQEELFALASKCFDDFLNINLDAIYGEKPIEYFNKYNDEDIMYCYLEYFYELGHVPELLNNNIVVRAIRCEKALFDIVCDDDMEEAIRMNSISLLDEIQSTLPLKYYVLVQAKRKVKDDFADRAFEALLNMPIELVEAQMQLVFEDSNNAGRDIMLEVLAKPNCIDSVFEHTLNSFLNAPKHKEIYAKFLGNIENEKALKFLQEVANSNDIDYIDFMEIRLAIEKLGGKCPKRDFTKDAIYRKTH